MACLRPRDAPDSNSTPRSLFRPSLAQATTTASPTLLHPLWAVRSLISPSSSSSRRGSRRQTSRLALAPLRFALHPGRRLHCILEAQSVSACYANTHRISPLRQGHRIWEFVPFGLWRNSQAWKISHNLRLTPGSQLKDCLGSGLSQCQPSVSFIIRVRGLRT